MPTERYDARHRANRCVETRQTDLVPAMSVTSSSVQTNAIRSSEIQMASAFVMAGMICVSPERLRAYDAI